MIKPRDRRTVFLVPSRSRFSKMYLVLIRVGPRYCWIYIRSLAKSWFYIFGPLSPDHNSCWFSDRLNLGDGYHICTKVCNKKLECGCQCEQQCHRGSCRRCPNVSFDELRCHCGAAVVYPPVYCGTAPPECSEPCTRVHPCGHDVFHNCHSEAQCPPCPVLMEKRCNCGKSVRGAIPCFQQNVSCGAPCDLKLSCGHYCDKTCHVGDCEPEGFKCTQPCSRPRPNCPHICGKKCHPDSPCEPFEQCRLLYFFRVRVNDDDKRSPANGTNKCWTTRGAKIKNRVDLVKELLSTLNVMVNVLSKKEIEKLQKL